ncbi:hypothetical protein I6E74_02910 [Salinibacterium sp. SWN139]|uniref:hypothetical protein n=1 Tax=Salinibacterium sp. SWN139 TaxID=2792055 RepID=UPI0018CE52E4|nr:hypothetical protein [Salinibacterium sp. SWN139]MBH0053119.1 hypothetical protein [Salinibacterium sp. SWN139]
MTIVIEAKDFKETDSGIEYIGLANQQMGDGGLIAQVTDVADDWFATDFDSRSWNSAGVFSAAEVSPKDGYNEVSWDSSAELIGGTSLTQDNTILFRQTVDAPQCVAGLTSPRK